MPKYQRKCSNPFHEKWSKRSGETIVSLRARGLVGIANVFEKYVEEEMGKKSTHAIKYLCRTCLHDCFKKRKFTKLLPKDKADDLKNKVDKEVCKTYS